MLLARGFAMGYFWAIPRVPSTPLLTCCLIFPPPLIAFVVLGGAAATASFVFDRRGGAVGPEAAPAEEGEPWVSSFAAPPDAACEDEEECVLPDMD